MNEKHVIFGTGPLGISTMRALVKRGKNVVMVNRSGKLSQDIPVDVEIAAGDAFDQEFTTRVTKGAEAVYQCAQPAYNEWVTKFPPLQKSILEAATPTPGSHHTRLEATPEVFVGAYDAAKLRFPDSLINLFPANPLKGRPATDNHDWEPIRAWANTLHSAFHLQVD